MGDEKKIYKLQRYIPNMKKSLWVLIIIGILVLIGIIIVLSNQDSKKITAPYPEDLSVSISPSQAYLICNEEECTSDKVIIQGNFTRISTSLGIFSISDGERTVHISFEENVSIVESYISNLENHVLKGGIVEADITGILYGERDFCTNDGCKYFLKMRIKPEDISFIKKIRCREGKEMRIIPGDDDCFNFPNYEIDITDAYDLLDKSLICNEGDRKPRGGAYYFEEEGIWTFGISSVDTPGGCGDSCKVSKEKITFIRTCAQGAFGSDVEIEEKTNFNLSELYEECIKKQEDKLSPAKDEPIGAQRIDGDQRIWTKSDEIHSWDFAGNPIPGAYAWKSEQSLGSLLSNEAVDEFPGGANDPDFEDCNRYLI